MGELRFLLGDCRFVFILAGCFLFQLQPECFNLLLLACHLLLQELLFGGELFGGSRVFIHLGRRQRQRHSGFVG